MPPITGPRSEKSSTPPEDETLEAPLSDDLLNRLLRVSDKKVDTATRAVSEYSEDDDAHDKRWSKAETRRTFYKIRRWFFWFLFGLICLVATMCSFGYLYLVYIWVSNLIWGTPLKNADGLKDIITSVLWTVLVIFATLFGESVFKEKND